MLDADCKDAGQIPRAALEQSKGVGKIFPLPHLFLGGFGKKPRVLPGLKRHCDALRTSITGSSCR